MIGRLPGHPFAWSAGMRADCVPVTMGSPRFTGREVGAVQFTDAWFPPGATLDPHVHERATFAVMLEGSFDVRFRGRICAVPAGTVVTEPAGEQHGNRIDRAGAHVLVLQPARDALDRFGSAAALFGRITQMPTGPIAELAWQAASELVRPDDTSELALEGIGLQIFAAATRIDERWGERRAPVWLGRVEELLRARFRDRVTLDELAAEAGVHPAHLGRTFRDHYRVPVSGFVRRLRLEWARREIATGRRSLAAIAIAAGFADQAHFTRSFKRHLGTTPERYRRAVRSPSVSDGSRST